MFFHLYCLVLFAVKVLNVLSEKLIVIQIIPRTSEDLFFLSNLNDHSPDVNFWKNPRYVNETVDVMLKESQFNDFALLMKQNLLEYHLLTIDVLQLLNATISTKPKSNKKVKRQSSAWNFGWNRFHTLDEIYNWMDSLARTHSNNVRIIEAGRSYEGRAIKGVHLKFGQNRRAIFIEAGIHAREWISHATATYLINELLRSSNSDVRWLANTFDWYIFPVVNPDGYVFTHINPGNANYRMWRKTRSFNVAQRCYGKNSCYKQTCFGADANRNWDFQWGGPGSSRDPCSEIFAGNGVFSEVEVKNLAKFISSVADNLFAYVSFHSYIQKLLIPYGHTAAHLDNYNDQFEVGRHAVNAISQRYGTRYQLGNIAEILGGFASGSSLDWVKANLKLPFVYCYELRGQTSNGQFYGFLAPPSEIVPTGQETVDSLVALFRAATRYNNFGK